MYRIVMNPLPCPVESGIKTPHSLANFHQIVINIINYVIGVKFGDNHTNYDYFVILTSQ
ncbi:hypothetical protein QNH39_06370 [Neobacillus novalis]|uniref:Uncharacterized protein n=1 Tax=Neobacillus novalis TaxID=220687 RepID=A0AA95MT21_9BACI|nr:hypothetical protein [Neobacillus novalis]WHY87475.1 hypothetical protein QNH39_06370 [Neobacillus novalis]